MLLLCAAVASLSGVDAAAQQKPLSKRDRLRLERPAPLFPLEPAWTTPLPAAPVSGPALDDERVYVPLVDGTLAAADRDSGERLWTIPVDVALPPVVSENVVVTAGTGRISGFDAASGASRWSVPLDAQPAWLVADGDVAVAAVGRHVRAYSVSTGIGRWSLELSAPVTVLPAISDGRIAVADDSGAISLVDLEGGAVAWSRMLPDHPGAVALTADRVFVGTSREFRSLTVSDGATRWQWRTGGDVSGARAEGDRVFVITLDNLVRALDAGNGNQQWKATLSARPAGAPLLLRNLVVVSGVAPRIEGFARKTGATAGAVVPAAEVAGAPAIAPALEPFRVALVVATRAGALHGFRPERMMFRDPPSAPMTVLPGRRLVPEPVPTARPIVKR